MLLHSGSVVAWFLVLLGLADADRLYQGRRAELYTKCVGEQQYLSVGIDLAMVGDMLTVAIVNSSGDPGNMTFLNLAPDEETGGILARLREKGRKEKELIYNESHRVWNEHLRIFESWNEYLLRILKRLSTFSGIQEVFAEFLNKLVEFKIYLLSEAPPTPPEMCKIPEEPSYYDELVETFTWIMNGTKSVIKRDLGINTDTNNVDYLLSFPPYLDEGTASKLVIKALQNVTSKVPNLRSLYFGFHTYTAIMEAEIRQGANVLVMTLEGWHGLQLATVLFDADRPYIKQNSMIYPDIAKRPVPLIRAMLNSAVYRAQKEGTWDGGMHFDPDETKMIGHLIIDAIAIFRTEKDIQELPLVFAFGNPEVLFEGVLLRSDLEDHEAFDVAEISTKVTTFMTFPTDMYTNNTSNARKINDYSIDDVYGPLMEIGAVVIIADTFETAELAERAVIMAGIEVPIFGAKDYESMLSRARDAAMKSARLRRKVVEDECSKHVRSVLREESLKKRERYLEWQRKQEL